MNINFDNYFKDLLFDARSHTYKTKDSNERVQFFSCTGLVNLLATPPDVNVIAAKRGVDPVELAKEWKEKAVSAARFGTRIHGMIEYYLNHKEYPKTDMMGDTKTKMLLEGFQRFYDKYSQTWDFVKQEYRVCDRDSKIAGTIDCIVWNKQENFYELVDWKTNKEIDRTFWHPLKVFTDKGDNSFNKYSIQLSIYKYILEKNIPGLKIGRCNIVHLMPEGVEVIQADEFDIEYLLDKLEEMSK